jgi:hypothetical protein
VDNRLLDGLVSTQNGHGMKSKALTLLLSALITSWALGPSQATTPQKSLVIIDTGFDTSIPAISQATIFESCILSWSLCPNGRTFQEGPGTASLPVNVNTSNNANMTHGTQMASIAMNINPSQKLVLIRLVAFNARGERLPVYESTVLQAFRWISSKREELNIGAVAMAQGYHPSLSGKNYCPKVKELDKLILDLKLKNVPVFFPAGNAAIKTKIDWPACIPVAMAIGAIDTKGEIANYSNYDRNLVDFYVQGSAPALLPGGGPTSAVGTSVSTLIAASYWLDVANLKPELTAPAITQLFRDAGRIIFDSKFRYGREMQMQGVLSAQP